MKCPACGVEMATEDFGGAKVQVCESGCKGIWFDHGELARLDDKNEGAGAALDAALRSPRHNDGQRGPLKCPKCGVAMHAHTYRTSKEVNVDECYVCGGFFLDSGELTELRDHHMSPAELQAYTDQLVNTVPGYLEEQQTLADEKTRLAAINRLSSLLTRQYWGRVF